MVTGKCSANEQYSRRECLEISSIHESVSENAFEDNTQGVLRGIDVKVHTENIELCHCIKGKGNKGKEEQRKGDPKTFQEKECRQNKIKQEKADKY